MCSEFSDVVLGWYKRRTWHLKKWSFFQIQKETVAAKEVFGTTLTVYFYVLYSYQSKGMGCFCI
jgi:hypothetical protein